MFFGSDGVLFTHPTYSPNLRLKITYYDTLSLVHSDFPSYLYDLNVRNIRPAGLFPSGVDFTMEGAAGGRIHFGGLYYDEVLEHYAALSRVRMFKNWVLPLSTPASPEVGSHYFDASTNTLYIHNGSAWKSVTLT